MSKEMLGGCCVCSDERGWTENPLVYCDGQGCSVAVHQACYGIVSVPTGPWFCRKCESQERAVRVKCELCPSKDGALKRTDTNGWAHVVCALYIPEVRFGNVTTMEPIILTLIPQERFSRTCYICQEQGKATKATSGACMQCNKVGCKQQFHVTCAQALGLLCEEAGNYMDNVKYCGYCQHHNSKLKKGAHVKSVPPYKPIATEESPEKEVESNKGSSAKKKSYLAVKPSLTIGKPKSHSPSPDVGSIYNMDIADSEGNGSGAGVTLKIGTTSSHATDSGSGAAAPLAPATDQRNKFTTSNFIETVVTQSEPVFGSDSKSSTSPDNKSKKRKSSIAGVKTETTETTSSFTPISSASQAQNSVNPAASKNLSVTLSHVKTTIASSTAKAVPTPSGGGKTTTAPSPSQPKSNLAVYGTGTKITIAATREDPKKSKPEGVATSVVTGPLSSGSSSTLPMTENSPTPAQDVSHEHVGNKRQRSGSQEKGRKPKRPQNRRPAGNVKEELDSPPGSPDQSRRKKANVKEEKDVKPLQTVSAPHMLGNQLNPASSMAQKMHDSLHQEVEAHSIYSQDNSTSSLVGAPLPRKFRASTNDKTLSAANSLLSLGNSTTTPSSAPGTSTFSTSVAGQAAGTQPQGLEQLLERQWEQGNQFLMEQAQHFDIASLLSCLHQLKSENLKLEDHVNALQQRREHLLAVNARLNIPLGGPHTAAVPSSTPDIAPEVRTNGGDAHSFPAQLHISPSPPMRNPAMANAYNNAQARRPVVSQYQQYPGQPPQMGATGNPQSLGMRRDDQHQM